VVTTSQTSCSNYARRTHSHSTKIIWPSRWGRIRVYGIIFCIGKWRCVDFIERKLQYQYFDLWKNSSLTQNDQLPASVVEEGLKSSNNQMPLRSEAEGGRDRYCTEKRNWLGRRDWKKPTKLETARNVGEDQSCNWILISYAGFNSQKIGSQLVPKFYTFNFWKTTKP